MRLLRQIAFSLVALSVSHMAFAASDNDDLYADYYPEAKRLLLNMHLGQKIGQMIMPSFSLLADKENCTKAFDDNANDETLIKACGLNFINEVYLGAVLADANYMPFGSNDASLTAWKKLSDLAKSQYNGPAKTQLLLGTDAVHGDQHVLGATLFPHNIGLGSTHNPKLIEQVAAWTAHDVQNSGFNWNFAPSVGIAYDYRWGRTYESFSGNPQVTTALADAYITGLQSIHDDKLSGVLASAKHFLGDGDTNKGIDEGDAYSKDLNVFWDRNIPGFTGAIAAQTGSIMASYSSLNYSPMHFGGTGDLINRMKAEKFLGKYEFGGFVVSDYNAITRAQYKYNSSNKKKINYPDALAKAINAGVDMIMVGTDNNIDPFAISSRAPYQNTSQENIEHIKKLANDIAYTVRRGWVSERRIDDAVTRILAVKLAMQAKKPLSVSGNEQATALQAAEESLVLLKNRRLNNDPVLPLDKKVMQNIILMGNYDDIGRQNGGWSVTWQGITGNKYWEHDDNASSIIDGLKQVIGNRKHYITNLNSITDHMIKTQFNPKDTAVIVVLAETPYAEYMGDIGNDNPFYRVGALQGQHPSFKMPQATDVSMYFSDQQAYLISQLRAQNIPVITVLLSGRPMVITEGGAKSPLLNSDAFIAAWLPGTTGGKAIANALFGNYRFGDNCRKIQGKQYCSNTLSFAWPLSMDDLSDRQALLFGLGYGLKT